MWWRRAAFGETLAEAMGMPTASCQDLLVFGNVEEASSFVSRDDLIHVKDGSEIQCLLTDLY